MEKKRFLSIAAACVALLAPKLQAQGLTWWTSGTVVPNEASYTLFLLDISDNGESFVGSMSVRRGFELSLFYQRSSGLLSVPLPSLFDDLETQKNYDYVFNGVSPDGTRAVGQLLSAEFPTYRFAVDYRVGQGARLFGLPQPGDPDFFANLVDLAADGTAVGRIQDASTEARPILPVVVTGVDDPQFDVIPRFLITSGGNPISVRVIPSALSEDGTRFAGAYSDGVNNQPVIGRRPPNAESDYTFRPLQVPAPYAGGGAVDVSNSGQLSCGFLFEAGNTQAVQACVWNAQGQATLINLDSGEYYSVPESMNRTGQIVTGAADAISGDNNRAFIWIAGKGASFLDEWLLAEYGLDTSGFRLETAIVNAAATRIGGIARPVNDPDKPQFYLVSLEEPVQTSQPVFASSTAYEGDWYLSSWFGWYNTRTYPYLYHLGMDWIYHFSGGENGAWMYHSRLGWFWMDGNVYPWLYQVPVQGSPQYLYHLKDTAWFFSQADGWFVAR